MAETLETTSLEFVDHAFALVRKAVPRLRKEPISARVQRLQHLRKWIHANRPLIHKAMHDDFRKPATEVDVIEVFHVLNEIKLATCEIELWARPKKVDAPITMLGTRSEILYEPRGACLIISPWNYPFSLSIGPLVSALAAGNSVVLKPSEMTPHVSALIARMVADIFEPDTVKVCEGGPDVARRLLALPFDHIFFTGSPAIGKIVMKAAAENLTSVTLELGGKSPSIITGSARIAEAARRTAVAKFVNNGQTCIAPDYVLADEKIAGPFIKALVSETKKMFSANGDFEQSASYCRIVNDRHFARLRELLDDAVTRGAKLEFGGQLNAAERFVHPVIASEVSGDARILNEEIFGPILPVVTYKDLDEALDFINKRPKPLALYAFTCDATSRKRILTETSSGGACINDTGIHFLNHNLPFGGINNSGIGKSHGHYGFLAFSNEKPVLTQKRGFTTVQSFYPPYTSRTAKLVDWFLKLF